MQAEYYDPLVELNFKFPEPEYVSDEVRFREGLTVRPRDAKLIDANVKDWVADRSRQHESWINSYKIIGLYDSILFDDRFYVVDIDWSQDEEWEDDDADGFGTVTSSKDYQSTIVIVFSEGMTDVTPLFDFIKMREKRWGDVWFEDDQIRRQVRGDEHLDVLGI